MKISLNSSPQVPEMPGNFSALAHGKNKILWGYFGLCDEYPIILSMIRKFLKNYSPEISITIATREEAKKWTKETLTEEEFRTSGDCWIEKIEFKTSPGIPHIIERYISGLPIKGEPTIKPKIGNRGLIITENKITGKFLLPEQVKKAEIFLSKLGLIPVLSGEEEEVGAVVGVEHPAVWASLSKRKPVAVPEYSVGLNLLTKFGGICLK